MSDRVSIEVAEHALAQHVARTGPITPYHVATCHGFVSARDTEFEDMAEVRDDQRMRAGRTVDLDSAYRLQQWLAAEAMIAARWPEHRSHTVHRGMLDGLDHGGIPSYMIW